MPAKFCFDFGGKGEFAPSTENLAYLAAFMAKLPSIVKFDIPMKYAG